MLSDVIESEKALLPQVLLSGMMLPVMSFFKKSWLLKKLVNFLLGISHKDLHLCFFSMKVKS